MSPSVLSRSVSRLNRLCRFSHERGSNEEDVGGPAGFAKEFSGCHFGCDIFAEFLIFQVIKIRESLEEQWEKTRRCLGGGNRRWSCNFGSKLFSREMFLEFFFPNTYLQATSYSTATRSDHRSSMRGPRHKREIGSRACQNLHMRYFKLTPLPMNVCSVHPLSHHHRQEIGCSSDLSHCYDMISMGLRSRNS